MKASGSVEGRKKWKWKSPVELKVEKSESESLRKCWRCWRMLEAPHQRCCNKKLALNLKWRLVQVFLSWQTDDLVEKDAEKSKRKMRYILHGSGSKESPEWGFSPSSITCQCEQTSSSTEAQQTKPKIENTEKYGNGNGKIQILERKLCSLQLFLTLCLLLASF